MLLQLPLLLLLLSFSLEESYACTCDVGHKVFTQLDQQNLKHCLDHLAMLGV